MPEWECKALFKIGVFSPLEANSENEARNLVIEHFLSEDVFDDDVLSDFQDYSSDNWLIKCRKL